MKLTQVRWILAFTLLLVVIAVVPRAAAHGDSNQFTYSAKVFCSTDGTVTTTINVHNPDKKAQTLSKEGIALDVGQVATAPGKAVADTLNAGYALQMGCADLTTLGAVGPHGFGDVVIQSPRELDIWAVYLTGTPSGEAGTLTATATDVVRVPASRHEGSGEGD
jgi:hypothetical protein